MKVTKEMSEQIVMMYQNKVKWRDIAAHFSISTYTVKKVLDKYGKEGRPTRTAPAFRSKITIDGPEGEWLASQEDPNEAIRQLIATKIAYSQIEGTSQKQKSCIEDSRVETKNAYSESEGTPKNVDLVYYNEEEIERTVRVLSFADPILLKHIAEKTMDRDGISATSCKICDIDGNLITSTDF